MEQKRTCPECNLIFEAPQPEAGLLTCPLCDTVFSARPPAAWTPPAPVSAPVPPSPSPVASAQHVWKGCLAIGTLLFLVGGLVYAYRLMGSIEPQAASTSPPPAAAPTFSEPPPIIEIIPSRPAPPPQPIVRAPKPSRPPTLPKPSPLPEKSRPPLPLSERINRAIDRGVAHLRKNHNGHDQYHNYLGLLGLTLLECGIPAKDPAVRQIATWLRTRELDLANTYELSLAILFFDRLNDPQDRSLIRTFGQRLLAGQLEGGAWTYSCPVKDNRLRPGGQPTLPPPRDPQGPRIISWRNSTPIPNPLAQLPNPVAKRKPRVFHGDNSNTQFAILGLWVAQRHGVSARRALLTTEQYFRETQMTDGSWSYHPFVPTFRDSMTCAGLMSVAMRYGAISGQGRDIRPDRPVQVSNRAIRQGLRFLGRSLDKVVVSGGRITGVEARDPLYFLWSLERMAVIYDLKIVGDKEWYPWAAAMLVDTQHADGSWHAPYPSPVGTCFALLILKRSNVAHDLHLAVQSETPRRGPGLTGPATTPRGPAGMSGTTAREGTPTPLGPTTIGGPKANADAKKPDPPSVLEIPNKK